MSIATDRKMYLQQQRETKIKLEQTKEKMRVIMLANGSFFAAVLLDEVRKALITEGFVRGANIILRRNDLELLGVIPFLAEMERISPSSIREKTGFWRLGDNVSSLDNLYYVLNPGTIAPLVEEALKKEGVLIEGYTPEGFDLRVEVEHEHSRPKLLVECVDFKDELKTIYTPEGWDAETEGKTGLTGKDFLDICFGDEVFARYIYGLCEWEHPNTLIDEHLNEMRNGDLEEKSHEYQMGKRWAETEKKSQFPESEKFNLMWNCMENVYFFLAYAKNVHGAYLCAKKEVAPDGHDAPSENILSRDDIDKIGLELFNVDKTKLHEESANRLKKPGPVT